MNLLLYSLIIPLFGGPALGDYDSYDSLCPGQDGKTVTLPGGEYTVTCGGYYDWLVTGNRVDSGTRDSPEECVRLCSQSQDCDAMVYDSGACWEYSAQSQFLTPQVDPHGHTILLGPVLKKDPDSPDDSSDQTPITPPKTPEDYQQELDECNQEKSQLQTDKDSCVTDRDEYKADKDTCITDRDQFKKEKDLCITDRDQFKKERDQFKKERDQLKKEKDLCITDRDQFKKERDQFKQQRDVCNTDKQKVIGERDACLKKLATPPAPPPNLGPNNLFPDNYQCNFLLH
ncbi:hypothetical protein IFM46972_03433 [Aspergillus udagawae]|uniref:Apple domain-containing protein n=1 Tax=Aspergillus udagawae TaxID=91492 RepID=A0A8H3NLB1_9EURO|nr:hypothetical protein IFM46972_03433 [Aspergillus udagawae]